MHEIKKEQIEVIKSVADEALAICTNEEGCVAEELLFAVYQNLLECHQANKSHREMLAQQAQGALGSNLEPLNAYSPV